MSDDAYDYDLHPQARLQAYDPDSRQAPAGAPDFALHDAMVEHLSQHFEGANAQMLPSLEQDGNWVSLALVHPCDQTPWWTVITVGMSSLPMQVTDPQSGQTSAVYAELSLVLPPTWDPFEDQWPLHLLTGLAEVPHSYNSSYKWGDSFANGHPPEPLVEGSALYGGLMLKSELAPESFDSFEVADGRQVDILSLMLVTEEEMRYKVSHGLDALLNHMDGNLHEMVLPGRSSWHGAKAPGRRGFWRR